MTQAPVSLDEVRAHLNLAESEGHDGDDELWQTTLAAVAWIEARLGAIRPRTRTDTVRASGYCYLRLPGFPVMSVDAMTDQNGNTVDVAVLSVRASGLVERVSGGFGSGLYTVAYTVGQDPIQADHIEAVLLKTGLLWSSQRGPAASGKFAQDGGLDLAGGRAVRRLDDILSARPVMVA